MRYAKLWLGLAVAVVGSFALLGYYGIEIYREAPPAPERVVTESGRVLFTGEQIKDGQNVWQSMGGQEVGTVWGHGGFGWFVLGLKTGWSIRPADSDLTPPGGAAEQVSTPTTPAAAPSAGAAAAGR